MPDLTTTAAVVGPHPVRAPRGSAITCRNWLIEAAYRMIQNNLDPEVAENPDALVVYGGIGKAARDWPSFEAILKALRRARRRRDAAGAIRQAGRRVPHHGRFAARADRQLEPGAQVGDLGALPRARSQGPDDVRPDDRGLVDLHRQPGHRPGHLRDLRRGGTAALRRRSLGAMDPHRGPRRHGRRAAARRDLRRRDRRSTSSASSRGSTFACARAISTSRRAISTTRSPASSVTPKRSARSRSACSATPPSCCPSCCGARRRAASGPTSSPTRPRRTTSSTATCPPAGRSRSGRQAQAEPERHAALRDAAAKSCATHVQAMLDFQKLGIPVVDYGNNIRQVAFDEGVADAFAFPGFVPAYIRPLFCRGKGPFRWVALSGDPDDIRKTDAKMKELFPADTHLHRWLDMASERIAFQGLPARICWIGLGERHRAGLAFNAMVEVGRAEGADRHRPRSPRRRLGGEPEPRDRIDEGRQRRRLRLADAERAAQHRRRRDLGLAAPRRRRRHGLFAARRRRHRLRRQRLPRRSGSSACSGTTRRPA